MPERLEADVMDIFGGKKRADLEKQFGKVRTRSEVEEAFEILDTRPPFIKVKRKEDGEVGSMLFMHNPPYFFEFVPAPDEVKL